MWSALLLALAAPAATPDQSSADEPSFLEGLESVHEQMERRRWGKARTDLDALLLEHRRRDYVLAHSLRIREDMKRIVFQLEFPEPEPASLVAGELGKWSDKGDIEVVFSGKDLSEFEVTESEGRVDLPMRYTGNYEVVITGKRHPDRYPMQIILDQGVEGPYYIALFGGSIPGQSEFYPAKITRYGDGAQEILDETDRPNLEFGREFEIEIKVTSSKIRIDTQGKKMLDAKRDRGDHGWFAIAGLDEAALSTLEIRVDGRIEPSWMQNKIDAAMEEKRDAFDAAYDEKEYLPQWFLDEEVDASAGGASEGGSLRERAGGGSPGRGIVAVNRRVYPGPELTGGTERAAETAILGLIERFSSPLAEQLAYVEQVTADGALSPLLGHYLQMRLKLHAGQYRDALPHAEAVVREDPAHLESRYALGEILDRVGEAARADGVWESLADDFPRDGGVLESVAVRYMLENRVDEAAAWVAERAKDAGARDVLAPVQQLLVMARSGPSWNRVHEDESRNYVVRSDLDEDLCEEASRLLERAYTAYSLHLKKIPGLERSKFRVYLFSGEEGYKRYAGQAFGGGEPESTAGVYSGLVKQLLIWNLPDRDEMFRTILHEGFHQYLDQVMPDPPVWFNEGMAEYFELQETVDGKWVEGQVHPRDLRIATSEPLLPLAEYVRLDHRGFRSGDVLRNYAQGWAFVHLLRNSTRENRALFDRMFETFCERGGRQAVVEEVFRDVDLADLDRQLEEHLRALRSGGQ